MLETLKHSLGLCGEPHPSLLWFVGSGSVIFYLLKHNIQWCWRRGCDYCKSKMTRRTNDNDMGS